MSDQYISFGKQLNRRELGKVALAGALGVATLDWLQSGFAQEQSGSMAVRPSTPGTEPGIKLSCTCPVNATDEDLLFYKQMGVDAVRVSGVKPEDYNVEGILRVKKRFADAGLTVNIINVPTVGYLMEDIVLNGPGRDKAIESYKIWFHMLASAGVTYLPRLFGVTGSASSGYVETRSSRVPDFDINSSEITPNLKGSKVSANTLLYGRQYSKDEIWGNYTYFIKQVAPVAEETGVRIGLHPDDPPIPSMFGVPRILSNFDDYKKALAIANSLNVGVLLDCGTWEEGGAATGIDTAGFIRYFGSQKNLFEVRLSSISAPLPHFHPTYPDNGYYDTYKIMKALVDVQYNGVVNLENSVPMVGGIRTYEAFNVGYVRAMLQRARVEAGA